MPDNLLLVGPRACFFDGELPRKGELGRVAIRPNQEATTRLHQEVPTRLHQITNQAAINLTNPGGKAVLTQHNQGGFRSVTIAEGTITVTRPGHSSDRIACVHTSWWQTSPICSQLALSDMGSMGVRDRSRLPLTLESLASTQHDSTNAIAGGPLTSFKGRSKKSVGKRGCSPCGVEPGTPISPLFVVPKSVGVWRPIIN